ncbi:MAG: ATP-binding protein [Chlorobi bacterium]|nr:ATP-binding protein [Chlorobiota bacterium]
MIEEGEHLHQDFKFAITDSKKIARSLAAFANTDGGRLLIGVKDNGNIAGVSSDEEYYMIEAAASMYCSPPVEFTTVQWKEAGKTVLEIIVEKSNQRPHKAPDKEGKYKAYIRVNDNNIVANTVLQKVWKKKKIPHGTLITLNKAEKTLLNYLEENPRITFSRFCRIAHIPPYKAERILVNFVSMEIISMEITEKGTYYLANPEYSGEK